MNSNETTRESNASETHRVRPKAAPGSKKAATKKSRAAKARRSRAGTKSEIVLNLLRRAAGASLSQLIKATGWQAHSIRGFLSTASKKLGVKIESTKNPAGERVYHIVK